MAAKPATEDFVFKKAERVGEHTLIAIAGPSGSGKTYSALEFATGLVEGTGKRVAGICTENGRMRHYAPPKGKTVERGKTFDFDCVDLEAPYTPQRYLAVITAAEEKGYGAIVVDSFSHEWAGEGGLDEQATASLDRMCRRDNGTYDYEKAERVTALAWKDPKRDHKKMMYRLIKRKSHLIFCLRAEPKIKFEKVNGKMTVIDMGFQPICEKNFMFEMTLSMMMGLAEPGIPTFLKIESQFKDGVPGEKLLSRESGAWLARWSRGEDGPRDLKTEVAKSGPPRKLPEQQKDPEPQKTVEHQVEKDPPRTEQPKNEPKVEGSGKYVITINGKGDQLRTDEKEAWKIGMISRIEKFNARALSEFVKANKANMEFVLEDGLGGVFRDVEKAIENRRREIETP